MGREAVRIVLQMLPRGFSEELVRVALWVDALALRWHTFTWRVVTLALRVVAYAGKFAGRNLGMDGLWF